MRINKKKVTDCIMKKIKTLFVREFQEGHKVQLKNEVEKGCEWVLAGEGKATRKYDGSCCAIINGTFYKRYDAKKGKQPPVGAIPCQESPDEITGHFPHWVEVNFYDPADKWFIAAYNQTNFDVPSSGTYEAVGEHFNGNKDGFERDLLIKHGEVVLDVPRTYEGIREYLQLNKIEGIVFHRGNGEMCKIKRSDFGFDW